MRISDWSSDVCSSDLHRRLNERRQSMDTIVRFEGRTTSGYKPHKVDVDDPSGGRHDLPEEVLKGHYAEFIMPNLTPLPFPTVLLMVRADRKSTRLNSSH